ncbi:hypothetical protein EVAR_20636_1 [Eumeta japonica]|uniref:Uncharacterized protein n=1 Tax=Eumeta variegata TaxID=151549 RepID=A0A4C1VBW3_EUMVA|nr:hypothetical protein EVAR_20636_1 [Eumeta japonica]
MGNGLRPVRPADNRRGRKIKINYDTRGKKKQLHTRCEEVSKGGRRTEGLVLAIRPSQLRLREVRCLTARKFIDDVLTCRSQIKPLKLCKGSDKGAGSLETPSSDPESRSWLKYISGQFQQAQIWLGYIVPL